MTCTCGKQIMNPPKGRRKYCFECYQKQQLNRNQHKHEPVNFFGYKRYSRFIYQFLTSKEQRWT